MKIANGFKLLSGAVLLISVMTTAGATSGDAHEKEDKRVAAPEIDARTGGSAIALLVGSILLVSEKLRSRRKR